MDQAEQDELDGLDSGIGEAEFRSLEITAAAISMVGLTDDEPMPSHLLSKISANADKQFGKLGMDADSPWPPSYEAEKPSRSWFGWFGWVAAAAACVALAVNIYITRTQPPVEVVLTPPVETPRTLTPVEQRDAFLASTTGLVSANWAAGNVKELKEISGDVVWSDEKQAGFMRFRGLPANDITKETYQLWIFDKTQDKATPIDGGVFDVAANGEVVIPINAKLNAREPGMFAITIEKPGGVVVSKREKIAALATVELKTS